MALRPLLRRGLPLAVRRCYEVEALVIAQFDHPGFPALYEQDREALGNVPFGLVLALVQGMVLALTWRRSRAAS